MDAMKHFKLIQKEIDDLERQRNESLKNLYDLGLVPFYGYYEKILKACKEEGLNAISE